MNRHKHPNVRSSDFRGVSYYERTGRWQAVIKVGSKLEHLGYYDTEEAAAHAYDLRALAVFGDRALLNDPNWVDHAAKKARELGVKWNIHVRKSAPIH